MNGHQKIVELASVTFPKQPLKYEEELKIVFHAFQKETECVAPEQNVFVNARWELEFEARLGLQFESVYVENSLPENGLSSCLYANLDLF